MARLFDDSVPEYLNHPAAIVSAYPFTMGCWFNCDGNLTQNILMQIGRLGSDTHRWTLVAAGAISGDPLRFVARTTSDGVCDTSTGFSVGTWHHACAVATSATSRAVFIDGGSKGTNATNRTPTLLDNTRLGATSDASSGQSGLLAEAAIWDAALTDTEVAILGKGYSPLLVRPQSLVAYWPIVGRASPEIDLVGGFAMTPTGSVAADHPRVIYPAPGLWTPAAPVVTGVPVHFLHYARMRSA